MSISERSIVNKFFAAMQVGAAAEGQMMSLFREDAVYIEPFSGKARTHVGKVAIHKCMLDGWTHPLPEMRIDVDELEINGAEVRVRWTCRSPALPGGKGTGENCFTLRDGLIARLETQIIPLDSNS